MGRINVTSTIFAGPSGPNNAMRVPEQPREVFLLRVGDCGSALTCCHKHTHKQNKHQHFSPAPLCCKLTWLVLGGDPAARSHRVEQFTAL